MPDRYIYGYVTGERLIESGVHLVRAMGGMQREGGKVSITAPGIVWVDLHGQNCFISWEHIGSSERPAEDCCYSGKLP